MQFANAALIHYQQQQQQQQLNPPFPPNLIVQNQPLQQKVQPILDPQQQPPTQAQQQQQQQQQFLQQQYQPTTALPIGDNLARLGGQDVVSSNNPPGQYQLTRSPPDRDGAIFRYHALALNSTTVKLVWSLLNAYHADYFDIEWGPIPDSPHVFSARKLNGTSRDFTVHGLEPDSWYQFQLQGYHGDHAYRPQLVEIRTPISGGGGKLHQDFVNKEIMPLGVKAEAKSNNSIQLSWTEAEKPNQFRNSNRVNIIRYYINPTLHQQQQLSPSASSANNNNDNSTTPSLAPVAPQYHYLNVTNPRESRLIVQKLKPATEYAFAVKTVYYSPDMKKIFTQSLFSMDTIAKTFDLEPSPPRNFTIKPVPGFPDQSELNWLPPESPNGQLKGYKVLYANEQNAEKWGQINLNDTNNHWYVQNLTYGQGYFFKVRAINQRGQSIDSDILHYIVPFPQQSSLPPPSDKSINMPAVPANNVLLLIIICMVAILFLLFLIVSKLACRTRSSSRKPRKGSLTGTSTNHHQQQQKLITANGSLNSSSLNQSGVGGGIPKLNGFASVNSSSTVAARVGTLARRRDHNTSSNNSRPDFWISAMDQQADIKSNISEKSNSDLNMAMVSIQRDSPQFATTQLAPALPDYRFTTATTNNTSDHLNMQQSGGHYHQGQTFNNTLAYDQMDNATASALMTLTKRQQQQMQKYQIQFATTGGNLQPPNSMHPAMGTINQLQPQQQQQTQAPSPHQQPPPPPPLNIEHQHQQQQQSLYGTHQALANTRSLRLHRPTLYDPVSGSFVQSAEGGPPNYNSHNMHPLMNQNNQFNLPGVSNTLQFHPHQTSTLLSRRSTNTLRSFQTGAPTYGQLSANNSANSFAVPPPPNTLNSIVTSQQQQQQQQQPQQLLQSHQAVINQLNNSTYPSLPLKHVSAVRPQIMSSLEDQIEMELAEKEQQDQQQQQQQVQQQPTVKQ